MDGGLPGAEDVLPAHGPYPGRAPRRVRRRARQPEPGHRSARHRAARPAGGRHGAPSDHPRPGAGRRRGEVVAKAVGAQMVWIRRDAEAGGAQASRTADGVVHLGDRHRRGLRSVARATARGATGRRHRTVQARRAPSAQPHRRHRQCRRPVEGRQPPAARRCPPARRTRSRRCNWSRSWSPTAPPRS